MPLTTRFPRRVRGILFRLCILPCPRGANCTGGSRGTRRTNRAGGTNCTRCAGGTGRAGNALRAGGTHGTVRTGDTLWPGRPHAVHGRKWLAGLTGSRRKGRRGRTGRHWRTGASTAAATAVQVSHHSAAVRIPVGIKTIHSKLLLHGLHCGTATQHSMHPPPALPPLHRPPFLA